MNRPLYESEQNRADEQRIAAFIGAKFQCTFRKLPVSYVLDYAAVRNIDIIGWAEIKKRNNEFRAYADFMISLNKYREALSFAEDTNLPVRFYIQFGVTVYRHIPRFPIVTSLGGRMDRDDWQDIEPMARIEWDDFEPMGVIQ